MSTETDTTCPEPLLGWLREAVSLEASDLHLAAGSPPTVRVHGMLQELEDVPLPPLETAPWLEALCPIDRVEELATALDVDCSLVTRIDDEPRRFRVNLFRAQGLWGACLRLIPESIPELSWAGFPEQLADRVAGLRDGLVILTGVTGSGKSTSLAMLVDRLNAAGGQRIVTIEEPVEYVFPRRSDTIVTQREVGRDVHSFADGLKFALRQDPDVILVGEVRDRETAQIVLSAAETGHLVFTTLHTRDSKGAVTRFADLFPQESQKEVRSQLSFSLRAIVSQRLLPPLQAGAKRELALEVLWNTFPIASAIRSGKVESIDNYLITARDDGMVGFDESVRRLLHADRISLETAEGNVTNVSYLRSGRAE